jgi:hypothetical protein
MANKSANELRNKLSLRLSEIETGRGGAEQGILDALTALQLAKHDLLDGSLDRGEIDVLVRTITDELVSAAAYIRWVRGPFEAASALLLGAKGAAL